MQCSNEFGLWLENLRNSKLINTKPMTKELFTKRIQTNQTTYANILKGKSLPNEDFLDAVRVSFGLSIEKQYEMYDLYAKCTNTVPLDISRLVIKNGLVEVLRKYMIIDRQFSYLDEVIASAKLSNEKTASIPITPVLKNRDPFKYCILRMLYDINSSLSDVEYYMNSGSKKLYFILDCGEAYTINETLINTLLKIAPSAFYRVELYNTIGVAKGELPLDLSTRILAFGVCEKLRYILRKDPELNCLKEYINQFDNINIYVDLVPLRKQHDAHVDTFFARKLTKKENN